MKKTKIPIGVIGLGRIGWKYHCSVLHKHPDFELSGVADSESERCSEAEHVYHCPAFTNYQRLLESGKLKAVVVASPTHLHREMAEAALKQGLHVMLEKPMASNAGEAEAISRTASRMKRRLTVYQPHRAAAYFQQIRHMVKSGKIGKVYHVRRGMFSFARRNDWQSLRKFGGGILNNYGAHAIDQVLQLAGYDIRRVFCKLRRVASLGDAEDVVKILLETREGILGELDINQACAQPLYEFEVIGTSGVITYTNGSFNVRWFSPEKLALKTLNRKLASAERQYPSDQVDFHDEDFPVDQKYEVDVYRDFARSIRTRSEPFVKAKEVVSLMKVIEKCKKDSRRITVTPLESGVSRSQ